MKDDWDNFWNFIGVAFWVVVIGWFGISLFTPESTGDSSSESSYSNTVETTSDYDSYDYSEDTESSYGEESPSYYSSAYDMDCSDFNSWSEAQDYYENVSDDNLDRDEDGIACESLN
jgi:hypothetical protein